MNICIYGESLRPPTTGTPMRNMVRFLIARRPNDHFIIVFRQGFKHDTTLIDFIASISQYGNHEIVVDKRSRKISNLLGLLRIPSYCKVSISADVYLNTDCNSLGRKNRPIIITVHDLSSFQKLRFTSYKWIWQLKLRRFMIANGIRNSDAIVAISKYTKESICSMFPDASNKIKVVYNGIDEKWFNESNIYYKNDSADYWVWWGMISPRKNLVNLLIAYSKARILIKNCPNLLLVVSNEVPKEILKTIDEYHISDFVKIMERQLLPELINIVGNSSGVIFPSFIEGFGMPVIEAFALGKPVLTSEITSLVEVGGGLAILVNPYEVASITSGLIELSKMQPNDEIAINRKNWASKFLAKNAASEYGKIIDGLV